MKPKQGGVGGVAIIALLAVAAIAQFPIKIPKIPTGSPFEKEPPLTTSLTDAVTEVQYLDDFDAREIAPLSLLPRGADDGFVVERPGAYTFSASQRSRESGICAAAYVFAVSQKSTGTKGITMALPGKRERYRTGVGTLVPPWNGS